MLAFTQAQKALSGIRAMIPRLVTAGVVVANEPILYVEPENVPPVLQFLRDHTSTRCKALMDITAVDVPSREKRFEVHARVHALRAPDPPSPLFLCVLPSAPALQQKKLPPPRPLPAPPPYAMCACLGRHDRPLCPCCGRRPDTRDHGAATREPVSACGCVRWLCRWRTSC